MHICPFCHSKMEVPSPSISLSEKQRAVYGAIVEAGPDGIAVNDLMDRLYPGKSYVSLRTALYYIRRAIAPIQIVSKGKRYSIRLMEKKE